VAEVAVVAVVAVAAVAKATPTSRESKRRRIDLAAFCLSLLVGWVERSETHPLQHA
jgi:hypothetical protein